MSITHNIIHILSKLIEEVHGVRRDVRQDREETNLETRILHRENLAESRQIKEKFTDLEDELLGIKLLILELQTVLIPELVTAVKLSNETGESPMDIAVGQTSTLTFQALGASGNPTVPVGAPSWNTTNSADFALDTNSGVLSVNSSAAAGATTDVSVTVDNVTSNTVSYTVGAPAAEPVASVVLTGGTPA